MTKREKTLLAVAGTLAVVFGYTSLSQSISQDITALQEENTLLELQKMEIETKLTLLPTLEIALEDGQNTLIELNDSIQDYTDDEAADTLFTYLAQDQGLVVNSVSVLSGSSAFQNTGLDLSHVAMKTVSLSLSGTSDGLISLVDQLNQRGDVVLLSLDHTEANDITSYDLSCVLFMEYQDGWVNNELTQNN